MNLTDIKPALPQDVLDFTRAWYARYRTQYPLRYRFQDDTLFYALPHRGEPRWIPLLPNVRRMWATGEQARPGLPAHPEIVTVLQ